MRTGRRHIADFRSLLLVPCTFALHQASQAVWCMCMRALREPVCEIVFVTVACAAYSVLQTDYVMSQRLHIFTEILG